MNAEQTRLQEAREQKVDWKKWGPYLSERQWGTVREDYSDNGDAWNFFTHDQARSRAYRWGEDGIGGISDERQRLWSGVLAQETTPLSQSKVTRFFPVFFSKATTLSSPVPTYMTLSVCQPNRTSGALPFQSSLPLRSW